MRCHARDDAHRRACGQGVGSSRIDAQREDGQCNAGRGVCGTIGQGGAGEHSRREKRRVAPGHRKSEGDEEQNRFFVIKHDEDANSGFCSLLKAEGSFLFAASSKKSSFFC